MSVCTTEQYIATKLSSMETRMVNDFGVSRDMLDKIHALRQVSGVSLTQWAVKLHKTRDAEIVQQLLLYCDIKQPRRGAFEKLVCKYLACFRDATWSLLDEQDK
jgi:DNA-binding FadR family transcriptional regulator